MSKNFSQDSFIVGVLVGAIVVGCAWFLSSNPDLMPPSSAQTQTASTTSDAGADSGAVAVSNQAAGSSVLLDSVTVPPPGIWVAVREMNGTALGNVLGAVRVGAPRSDVSVPLLRATEPGRSYAVELYRDDNNGTFDPEKNSVYVDFDTDAPVIVYFNTTAQ